MTGSEELPDDKPLPALFWDETPEGPENPDKLALDSVLAESTPNETAEALKVVPL